MVDKTERDRIWRERIEGNLFGHARPAQDRPVAYLLAGQPGSGKSTLRSAIDGGRGVDTRSLVDIDVDVLRAYHPDYPALARADSYRAASAVHEDAGDWKKAAIKKATTGRYNLVIDGTLADPVKATALCKDLKAKGYEVNVLVAGRSETDSWLGVAMRHESARARAFADPHARMDAPRFVERTNHDGKADYMAKSVEAIAKEKLADRISIFKIGYEIEELRYRSGDSRFAGRDPAMALREIHAAPPTPGEIAWRADMCRRIDALMRQRGAAPEEREIVGIDRDLVRSNDALARSPEAQRHFAEIARNRAPAPRLQPLDVSRRIAEYRRDGTGGPVRDDRACLAGVKSEVASRARALERVAATERDPKRADLARSIKSIEADRLERSQREIEGMERSAARGREM